MPKLKKNTLCWLFNQTDGINAVNVLGARNITVIKAVHITPDTETEVAQYSDMIMHDSKEADEKAKEWMQKQIGFNKNDERYLYFRFVRFN